MCTYSFVYPVIVTVRAYMATNADGAGSQLYAGEIFVSVVRK